MAQLHNRVSNKELKQKLYEENFESTTISFYQYFPIQDPVHFRDEMYRALNAMQVFGRIYMLPVVPNELPADIRMAPAW